MTAPNTGDPSLLVVPTAGAPYLQAPDGTIVYTVDGSPVDLAGKRLIAAPRRNGANATILAAAAGVVTVGGVYNASAGDVGATLALANCLTPANVGSFPIVGVDSPNQVRIANAGGVAPDTANGAIRWAIDKGSDFAEGDPLGELAADQVPLNIVTPAPGPARFARYVAEQQPMTVSDTHGLFGKVQRM